MTNNNNNNNNIYILFILICNNTTTNNNDINNTTNNNFLFILNFDIFHRKLLFPGRKYFKQVLDDMSKIIKKTVSLDQQHFSQNYEKNSEK